MRRAVGHRSSVRRTVTWLALLLAGCATPAARTVLADDHEIVIPVAGNVTLAGTLSLPRDSAVRGVAVLIGGSGPQDRDGTRAELPGYAPWREVRDTLVARGMAVVRLDERGTGRSGGTQAGYTTLQAASDVQAVLGWLAAERRVRQWPVALVGHSEGAVIALLVARAEPRVRALALLGAPARAGRDIARRQRADLVGSDLARWPAAVRTQVLAAAEVEAESLAVRDPWLRTWFALDPRDVARDVRRPVLLVHGATDRQVPPSHADELAAVLRVAGAPVVQVQHLRDTDHLLLPDPDGDPTGYVRLGDRRIRPAALTAIAQFFAVHMAPAR